MVWRSVADLGRTKRSHLLTVARVILVSTLLVAPTTYTGGASAAHPHMFLQFWSESNHDSLDHHASSFSTEQELVLPDDQATVKKTSATGYQTLIMSSGSAQSLLNLVCLISGISYDSRLDAIKWSVFPHAFLDPTGWEPSLSDPPPRTYRPLF